MSGGSPDQRSNEPLSIAQLEGHLQLAMALREQLSREGKTYQYSARLAMESFGLELPVTMPLASFTQQPSRTNFESFSELVANKEASLQETLTETSLNLLKQTCGEIWELIRNTEQPSHEPRWKELQVVSVHLADFDPEQWTSQDSQNPFVQASRLNMATWLAKWHDQMNLGQEVMTFDRLYQRAFVDHQRVSNALGSRLNLSEEDAHNLINSLHGTTRAARMDAHTEPEQQWGLAELVANTMKFMETYSGAIPFKLQDGIQWSKEDFIPSEPMELHEIQLKLSLATAIRDYVIWTWRMEAARTLAVDVSILACKSAGFLRQFAAA